MKITITNKENKIILSAEQQIGETMHRYQQQYSTLTAGSVDVFEFKAERYMKEMEELHLEEIAEINISSARSVC